MSPAKTIALSVAMGVAVIAAGCAPIPAGNGHEILQTPPATLSIYKLAGRLGMTITEHTSTMVALHDGRNSVVLFPATPARLYVNGQALAIPAGTVSRADGMLFVPMSYEPAISEKLEPLAPFPPFVPLPTPPEGPPTPTGRLVVIDPGHGGKDPGAISVHGDYEKTIVLAVAKLVAARLAEEGLAVRMTRRDDTFIELEERSAIANRLRADLFVSIHADAAPNRRARGFTVYVARQARPASVAAAATLAHHLQASGVASRGRREADYRVLVGTSCPAVLVELGYLSNAQEAEWLARPESHRKLAEALVAGILNYFQKTR